MIQLTVRPDCLITQRHKKPPQQAQHSHPGARRIAEYGVTVGCVHALAGDTQIIRLWAPYPATAAAELYAVRWLAVEQHFVAALLQPPVAELLMPSSARTPGAAG
jgi:hypothetical protein